MSKYQNEIKQNKNFNNRKQSVSELIKKYQNKNNNCMDNFFQESIKKIQKIIMKNILNNTLQQLRKFMITQRNRELLYAAVYKNNNNLRKFKYEKKSQVLMNHQKQQQFELDEGVSTIPKKSDNNSGRDSRIDFQNLFQKHYDKVIQKQCNYSNSNSKIQPNQYFSDKRSKTDFSLQNSIADISQNIFDKKVKNNEINGHIINKYTTKKQNRASQHIFVVRNTERKFSESESKNKIKYIQIPVECTNIKIIQMNNLIKQHSQKKDNVRSNSLNINQIKNIKKSNVLHCPNDHKKIGQTCKYCKMSQRNNQMMKKYIQSTTLLEKLSFH